MSTPYKLTVQIEVHLLYEITFESLRLWLRCRTVRRRVHRPETRCWNTFRCTMLHAAQELKGGNVQEVAQAGQISSALRAATGKTNAIVRMSGQMEVPLVPLLFVVTRSNMELSA